MGTVKKLRLDELRTDGGLQLRARIDQEHVERLAEVYAAESPDKSNGMIPAVEVLYDSKTYWVWDGNHRILARARAGFETINCHVEKGTQRDAILKAAGANHDHGLPRSNADKRFAVRALLSDKTWRKRSDRWIADACKVSHPLVADVRRDLERQEEARRIVERELEAERVEELPVDRAREGKNGKTYQAPSKLRADELLDPDVPLFGGQPESDPIATVKDAAVETQTDDVPEQKADRVAWAKERFGWLWDQYRERFGDRADWMHFSLAFESFSVSEGKA